MPILDYPNKVNFCGGNFQNWIEVNLISKCNGSCPWCVEKDGKVFNHVVSWNEIAQAILSTAADNVILLGGEPTLFDNLSKLINYLNQHGKNVYVTTNGSKINPAFIHDNLTNLKGINISIHHYNLELNHNITGIYLDHENLKISVHMLRNMGIDVRINCNLINFYIDIEEELYKFITFAKDLGANQVRFAELKCDIDNFVDLAKILEYKYGLNDDPYFDGCNRSVVIDGMDVSFRQMCGFQISCRPKPDNPKQFDKKVVYYDGKVHPGWIKRDKTDEEKIKEMLII